MTGLSDVKDAARHAAKEVRHAVSDGQLTRALQLQHQQTLAALRDHRSELQELRSDLKRQRAGGGFPWGLVLLVGCLLYTSPSPRD